jgi:hypothetical protein
LSTPLFLQWLGGSGVASSWTVIRTAGRILLWAIDQPEALLLGFESWEHIKSVATFVTLVFLIIVLTWGFNTVLGIPMRMVWQMRKKLSYWMVEKCEWCCPAINVEVDNDFHRDHIKARGAKTRKPDHVISKDGLHYIRLTRSQATAKPVSQDGFLCQSGEIWECTHHTLRDKVEASIDQFICICRNETCDREQASITMREPTQELTPMRAFESTTTPPPHWRWLVLCLGVGRFGFGMECEAGTVRAAVVETAKCNVAKCNSASIPTRTPRWTQADLARQNASHGEAKGIGGSLPCPLAAAQPTENVSQSSCFPRTLLPPTPLSWNQVMFHIMRMCGLPTHKCTLAGCHRTWTREELGARFCNAHAPSCVGKPSAAAARQLGATNASTALRRATRSRSEAKTATHATVTPAPATCKLQLALVAYGFDSKPCRTNYYRFIAHRRNTESHNCVEWQV